MSELDVVTKPTSEHKCMKVSYNINTLSLLRVSATVVAILREVCYGGWIYQDTREVYAPLYQCEIMSFNIIWFKAHIDI